MNPIFGGGVAGLLEVLELVGEGPVVEALREGRARHVPVALGGSAG